MTESTDAGPRVFISWAHRERDWTVAEQDAWRNTVLGFANALVGVGIDTVVDLWHEHELGIDWTRWGQQQVDDSDHVLIALNRAWAERWAGRNDPTEGAGAVVEADALHGLLREDQNKFQRKAIIVELPGSDGGLPHDLARLTRRRVQTFDESGLEDLLRLLIGRPLWVRPPLGAVPILPPRQARPAEIPEATTADRQQRTTGDVVPSTIAARSGTGDDVVSIRIDEAHRGRWLVLCVEGNVARKHFAVRGGPRRGALVNSTDHYRGRVLIEPGSTSTLDLEIKVAGPWSLELADADTSARVLEDSLDGVGDDVLRWTGGPTSLRFQGNGDERHFAVVAHIGDRRKGLINTTDPYSGRVLIPEGPALLSVRATGSWHCCVED